VNQRGDAEGYKQQGRALYERGHGCAFSSMPLKKSKLLFYFE
jgi:hypothetical protein